MGKSPSGDLKWVIFKPPLWQLGRVWLSAKGQVFLNGCFFFTSHVIGGCELLSDFFSEKVFKELGLLNAGFSTESSGLDLYLSIV